MSADKDHHPHPSSLSDKANMGNTMQPTTKDEENQVHRDVVATGLRSERSTWWLQFLASAALTTLIMFLYDKFIGLPRRACPPCEAQGC